MQIGRPPLFNLVRAGELCRRTRWRASYTHNRVETMSPKGRTTRPGLAIAGWTRHQAIPRVAGPAFLVLRLRGVCGVGKTVGRGPVRGVELVTGADQTSVPTRTPRRKSQPAGRLSCRAWLRLIWWWFVVAADGIVWVTAEEDALRILA